MFTQTTFPSLGNNRMGTGSPDLGTSSADLSLKFLLNPLVNSTSGCCLFTRALIPSYLTTEGQNRQLTLAEVQFLQALLLSSKSVSGFTELPLLQFLVETLVLKLELELEL